MPTGATDLGFDVVANQPQTELNYRVFVDTSGTEASLASINAIQQAGGGGRLVFSTDAADGPLAQRMLIDNQGNVGIGTDEPNARLHVAGDAKFNGPLNVQGALTASGLEVSGVGQIGGNLSVTGKLTAASFAGNGAGLSNVAPADSSINSAKLAVDSASFSKVTGGKMVISADNVGIGTANPGARLDVAGDAKFNGPLNVQGALTVSGVATISGDLSVTGNLTAASFAGDGAGLSNLTLAAGSVTNAKLAEDAVSISKVSGGKMAISGDNVGIGTTSPTQRLTLVSGNISLPTANAGVDGNLYFGGITDVGQIGMRLFGGKINNQLQSGWIDVRSGTLTDGLIFRVDTFLGGAERMRITAAGNVGINTAVPTHQLEVVGNVRITGSLIKGGGGFQIDHPLDPKNKYLNHSFVESPERKNVYDGVATLDASGKAVVRLPRWFDKLNVDFRYQLTCLGAFAPAFIARELADNSFEIAGGDPGMKVSWQITGIRADNWALFHPLTVEEGKGKSDICAGTLHINRVTPPSLERRTYASTNPISA